MSDPKCDGALLQELLSATAEYLRTFEPLAEFADAFGTTARALHPQPNDTVPFVQPPDGPAFVRSQEPVQISLLAALWAAKAELIWRKNPTYIDVEFLHRYAYTELLGPFGLIHHGSVSAGLLYLAPQTFYPPHAHPAEEVYHLISGRSVWQQGGQPSRDCVSGARIHHASGVAHCMRSGEEPLLALYLWRGDLQSPALLVDFEG